MNILFANSYLLIEGATTNYFQCTSHTTGKFELYFIFSALFISIRGLTEEAISPYKSRDFKRRYRRRMRVGETMCGPDFFPGALEGHESFHEL